MKKINHMRQLRTKSFSKILAITLGLTLMGAGLAACGGSSGGSTAGADNAGAGTAGADHAGAGTAEASNASDGSKRIGVIQFAEHPSLKNCYDGLIKGLEEQGYRADSNLEIDYQIGQADMGVTNQIVQSFAGKKYDLIVGIATPAAQAAYNAAAPAGIPVLFNAVSDPKLAQLVNPDGSNIQGVTGVSDRLPIEAQLKMIRAFLPDAKRIGILFNAAEANSESSIKIYQSLADKYGFEIVTQGVNSATEVPPAAEKLLAQVDCLTNLTDNLVVQNLQTVMAKATAKKIPYFGSEEEQVALGCLAAEGLDYVELGRRCGEMAAEILNGKAAGEIPIETIEASKPCYNSKTAAALGIEIPESYKTARDLHQ